MRITDFSVYEKFFDIRWLFHCDVKILIVTDSSSGGFGSAGFHLGEILNILASDPWSHVHFVVTKANRGASGEAGVLDGFTFHTHDLNQYSQVWLFGIERTNNPLSGPELRALTAFMNNGGGVFATGDHENLGQAMCAEVPRVRSMRRWYHPNAGPNGEPVAPDQTGADRHDTLVGGAFDQSDEVPQSIRPRHYSRITGGGIIRRVSSFPHPVLCGPDGVIIYLPDHMHEGLCEVPANLGQSWTFDGETFAEYPSHNGHQESPEVIAWATSGNGGVAGDFGVLGAYDGHRSNVGRVVVDATWHHWFNINLLGLVDASNPASVNFDPLVVPKWEAIKAYFRNVAAWLARPADQVCLRNGGWLVVSRYYDILITHRPLKFVKNHLEYYFQLGIFARDALGRLASQCQTTRWIIDIIYERIPLKIDPWERRFKERVDIPDWLDIHDLETVALGGAVHQVMEMFGQEKGGAELLHRGADLIDKVAQEGASRAMAEYFDRTRRAAEESGKLIERLK